MQILQLRLIYFLKTRKSLFYNKKFYFKSTQKITPNFGLKYQRKLCLLLTKKLLNKSLHLEIEICYKIFKNIVRDVMFEAYPGCPPASILLARVTSSDQTSYYHFLAPITPQRTRPEWTPTRMAKFISVE